VTVRYQLLQPSQSDLLREGIKRVYGSTYPIPEFYDTDYLQRAISKGMLHCVVVLNENEQVVACMSTVLEVEGDVTADGSALMVAPEYRGQGIVAQLGHEMVETYQRLNLGGLHLYALGLHDLVQKQAGSAGAVVTGILPAWFSKEAKVSGYDYPDVRIGAVTLFMPLGVLPERSVYIPERYVAVLTDIYSRLALPRHVLPCSQSEVLPPATDSRLEVKPSNGQYRVLLESVGADLATVITTAISSAAQEGLEVSYVDIPLNDPRVDFAVEQVRSQGFFFGALMVDRRGCDRLRMQRFEAGVAAPEQIVIGSVEAADLLAFVLNDRESVSGV
jgi:GNAT superfamily N-acetyltransferase